MLNKKIDKIKEDIQYLKNIDGIYGKVSRVAGGYDLLYSRFWKGLSQLEEEIKKIKEEEDKKQKKIIYDSGEYTINTTPKYNIKEDK